MKKSDIDRILGRSKGIKETKEPKREEKEKDGALAEVAEWLDDKGTLGKLGNTYLDFSGHGVKGLIKGVEGIYDAGAGIVGAVGGIFDSDFKDDVGEHIKHDYTGEWFDELGFDEVSKKSYLEGNKVGEFAREAWGAVGNMLPSVGLAFIPAAGPAIAMAYTGASAGGGAMESALDKGAGYYGSLAYGTGVGAVEAVTEKIGGRVFGEGTSLTGKLLAGTKLGKFTSKGLGKVVETFVSEASEEALADLADPALQYVTGVDKNIGENYKSVAKGLPKTMLLGGTVGSILQGGNVTARALVNSERGGFKATRADEAMSYIGEVAQNYGRDVNKNAKYDKAINGALYDISRELTSMSDSSRKAYMNGMGVFKNAFNEDGSIKMDLRADANADAVSGGLRAISGTLKYAPIKSSVDVSEGAGRAKNTVEKLLGERASVVVSDKLGTNNALYNPEEGVIYINNNAAFTGEEIGEFVATHEVTHITEGTRAYAEMAIALEEIANDPKAPAALKEKIGDVKAREKAIRETYKGQTKNMSLQQSEYVIGTELTADLAGVVFGDEYAINKFAERNLPLVKKIFSRLKALATRGRDVEGAAPYNKNAPSVDRESARYLNKLVNKFGKAIDKAQGGVRISQLGREDEEKNAAENVEQAEIENVRFSKMNSESLESNVDNVLKMSDEEALKNKQEGNFVSIMKRTPGIILENVMEAQNHEVIMRFDSFYLAVREDGVLEGHYHDMGEFMKELPRKLSDPLAILKMDNGRINVFAEFTSEKNKNGIASVELNTVKDINSHFQKYNLVVSVFNAKDNYIKNNISKHGISVEYKKEDLTQVNPQLYEWLAIVNDKSSNNSISENAEKINTFDEKNADERFSKPKGEKFMPGRHVRMTTAEELVEGYDADTISAEEALKKLNTLGYKTGINSDNALDMLKGLIPEIREFATSEREAYRESNRKDTSSTTSGPPSPQVEGREGADNEGITEEDAEKMANEQARRNLDYWVNNGDFTQGSVRYVQNGKVKVKLAQTANEAQLVKFVNNHMMEKKYTNKDVKNIIDEILVNSNIWGYDEYSSYKGKLKGKSLNEVKKLLWAALNTAPEGERISAALDIADYIVKHGILVEMVDVTEDVWRAREIIEALEPYKHNIDISHIKGDIEVKYDKDRTPYTTWALKKDANGRGYTADEVAQALEAEGVTLYGERGIPINEADIFIAIHELYKQAHKTIKEAAPHDRAVIDSFNGEAAYRLKQDIAREIVSSFDKYGQETTLTKVEKKYKKEIASLKKRVKDVHEENRLKNAVLYEVQKIKDSKSGKYHNATETQDKALSGLKDVLSKIKYRSDINRSSTREIMKELSAWYTEDNPVLQNFAVDVNKRDSNEPSMSQSKGLYSPYIKSLIDLFLIDEVQEQAGKPLDVTELEVINQILHHMNFVFESYGKIWRGGRWVEATDVASEQLNILKETRENETTVARLLKQGYFRFFMDPELVCARLDGHDKNGYFTTLLEDLRQADIKQRHDEMLALQRYDEFEKKHKKYIKELMSEKNTVKVGNVINPRAEGGPTADILEIPRYAALDLYMVSKTRGALETFAETGWVLRLDSNKEDFEKPQATITEAQIKGIEAQMSKEDLELIEIMEEQYNVNLRRLKYDTDMIRLGMSNVFDGYYYPINRISANNLDSNDFFFDLERVSNSSFNNSRVKGAKQAIIVSNVLTKFKKHVNGVTRYANLSIPIENMTKLLNIDVGDNANMPQSITVFLHKTTDGKKAEKYIKTLIKDVQQVNIQTDESTKVVSFLRGAYAKSTLGFNPKVLFTQASSYIAGFGELRGSSLAYGIANIYKQKGLDAELDKYCPWAAVRHYEKGTTRAMTVTDKVNKAGDFFTKGIEFMDRQIVKLEFLACQKEAQARFNLKIGTEENKIKAGELLQELGLKTQQNQLTTEKSAAMRSPNEFAKTLTMFKADSMKQVSRFLESISAISILKKKMDAAKRSGDTAKYSALEVEYKRAQKSFCKYSTVIIASSVYMVLLARLFNKLYHKEEEDENKVLGFFEDLFGNICGMVPIISELYAFFVDGFEVNSFLYSTINNAMDAVKGTTELVSGIVNGENITSEDAMTRLRKLAYSIGALAGFPIKNVYKNTKALIDIVSPSFGDRVDSWFKEPSQKELEEKIEAGIEKGDDKAVSVSLSLLYDKYDLELKDNVLRQEYDRLMRLEMTKGEDDETKYSPLEAKIPDSIKIDDEEVEMERKDVNVFKNAFGEAEKSQAKIVKTVTYKKLNDEQRAYALRKINQYYFESTKYTYTKEKSSFSYYAKIVGIENLALIVAYAKDLKGDARLSRRQKIEAYIRSLHLNSVQTSLALRCLGYGDKENDKVVASYVSRASVLTKEERAEMLEIIK